jgi:TolB-like protein/DNA-binding winged helix-turn-helix (wHTH) protein/tetratricopeptide (TPR) repeat protein
MQTENPGGILQIGEWLADPALDTISRGTESQKLEPRTMRLLLCLAKSAGSVVSVDRLLTEVWSGVVVGSASVYQAVSQLRRLLGDVDPNPIYIATVPRKGYRLVAAVRRVDAAVPMAAAVEPAAGPVQTPRRPLQFFMIGGAAFSVIALIGLLSWNGLQVFHPSSADAQSIVVLPFVDMTAEKSDQAFCDGLTEELSNWLAQIPTLRVVARTSAFAFRGQGEDVRRIGKALDTNHVLEGSLRRSGNHMRVTAQLIDARNGYHLWSADFDRPMTDAIAMQEEISRSVAGILQVRLTEASERQFAARRTADSQAYQLYLLGRHYAQQLTPESTERAIDLFRQVLAADPGFAPAYTQLAYARLNQGEFRDLPIADVAAQIEPLIVSALRLDDRMSAAYAVRGALRASQSRTKESLDDLQFAIALNPNDMGAIAEMGRIRFTEGRPREALKNYDRAAALDPLNFTLQEQRCAVLDDLGRYQDAANACERARVLQPGIASPADHLAWLAESRGRIDEALRWNGASLKAEPNDQFDLYWTRATLFLSLGLAAPARAVLELGRSATKDEDNADIALLRVVYCEGGVDALRRYLALVHLDQSPHSVALFEAAYSRLLLGDVSAVRNLISRAVAAPDRPPGLAESPFYARGAGAVGTSYRVDLAAADLALGNRDSARQELSSVLAMLDGMIAAGVERNATYELRSKVYALQGRGDDAMRDLGKAVAMGWRRAWWATHEPYFASLRQRSDFRDLMAQVNLSNDELTKSIQADQQIYTGPGGGFLPPEGVTPNTRQVNSQMILGWCPGPCPPVPAAVSVGPLPGEPPACRDPAACKPAGSGPTTSLGKFCRISMLIV